MPLRACRNASHLDSRALGQITKVIARGLRKRLKARKTSRRGEPSRTLFIDRFNGFERGESGWHIRKIFSVAPISDADGNLFEFVQHVQLCNHQAVKAVDHRRVPQKRDIEPAATARASSDRSKFLAGLAQFLAPFIIRFGGKRPAADARDIGFRNSDYALNTGGWNARSSTCSSGGRA